MSKYKGKHRYPRAAMFWWHVGIGRDLPRIITDHEGITWFTNNPSEIQRIQAGNRWAERTT